MGLYDLAKSGRQKLVKFEKKRQTDRYLRAKQSLKEQKQWEKIKKAKRHIVDLRDIGLKRKKQSKTLSRKSRIRLI
jgi:hypothetical protein